MHEMDPEEAEHYIFTWKFQLTNELHNPMQKTFSASYFESYKMRIGNIII